MTWVDIKERLKKFILFFISSLAGTSVDLSVHWALSVFVFDSYVGQFIIAPVISFELATLTNYYIAYQFVWRERIQNRSARTYWRRFLIYNATCTGAFAIKFIIIQILHLIFPGLAPVLCNLIALCLSGTFNFGMNEFVVFKKKKKEE